MSGSTESSCQQTLGDQGTEATLPAENDCTGVRGQVQPQVQPERARTEGREWWPLLQVFPTVMLRNVLAVERLQKTP